MKGIFVVIITVVSFVANNALAQTTRLFGVSSDSVKFYMQERIAVKAIYPETNKFTGVDMVFKDGSPLTEDIFFGQTPTVLLDLTDSLICNPLKKHINAMFTEEQRMILKGESVYLSIIYDPATGKVSDYELEFLYNSRINANLPDVEAMRHLGRVLDERYGTTVTDAGKKLNYCFVGMKCVIQ